MVENNSQRNYSRRAIGLLACLLPFGLLITSLISGLQRGRILSIWGLGFMTAAAGLAALNFHLAFMRPLLYRRQHGSMEAYRNVSGLPGIGTLLTLIGTVVGFGTVLPAALGIAAVLLDTGGVFWFVIWTWSDASFWDK